MEDAHLHLSTEGCQKSQEQILEKEYWRGKARQEAYEQREAWSRGWGNEEVAAMKPSV